MSKMTGDKRARVQEAGAIIVALRKLRTEVDELRESKRNELDVIKVELAAEQEKLDAVKEQLAAEKDARAQIQAELVGAKAEVQEVKTQFADSENRGALEGAVANRMDRSTYKKLKDIYDNKTELLTELNHLSRNLRASTRTSDLANVGQNIDKVVDLGLLNTDSTQQGLDGLRYSPKALDDSLKGISANLYFQKLAIDGLPAGTTFEQYVQTKANKANLQYYLADQVGRTPLGKISVGKEAKEKTADLKVLAGGIISLADGKDKVALQDKVGEYITRAAKTRNGDIYIPSAGENSEHTKSLQGLMTLVNASKDSGQPSLNNLRASVFETLKVVDTGQKLTPEHFTSYLEAKRGAEQLYSIPSDFDIGLERRVLRHEKKIPDNQKQALKTSGSADLFAPSEKTPEELRKDIQAYLKVASAEPQKFGGRFTETSPNQYDPNYTKYKEDTRAMEALVKALENPHNEVLRANFTKAYGVQDGQNLIEEVKNGFAQDLKEFSKVSIDQLGSHLTRDPEKQKRINGLAEKIKGAETSEEKEAAFKKLVAVAAARRELMGLSSEVKKGSKGISKSTTSVGNLIDLLEKDQGLREQLGIKEKAGTELKRHVFETINDIKTEAEKKEALADVAVRQEARGERLEKRIQNKEDRNVFSQLSRVLGSGVRGQNNGNGNSVAGPDTSPAAEQKKGQERI